MMKAERWAVMKDFEMVEKLELNLVGKLGLPMADLLVVTRERLTVQLLVETMVASLERLWG